MYLSYLLLTIVVSFALTSLSIQMAKFVKLFDVPNSRSSHEVPTPVGGGVAMLVTFEIALIGLYFFEIDVVFAHFLLLSPGILVALVGLLDDFVGVPPIWRLVIHFVAAIISVRFLNSAFVVVLGLGMDSGNSLIAQLFLVFVLVWLTNIYNFMDGINGIAGVQAITVLLSGGLLLFISVPDVNTVNWYTPMILAASAFGFLLWNFPKAKIFLGDSGSGFLGFVIGVIAIDSTLLNLDLAWAWVILLGVFVVDTAVTLITRILAKDSWYLAHRTHAYQNLATRAGSHTPVTIGVCLVNLFWLLPWASLVVFDVVGGLLGVSIAYSPLLVAAIFLKAGKSNLAHS